MPHKVTHSSPKHRRTRRTRAQVHGTADHPRLSVFRSHRHIYAQIINDDKSATLTAAGNQKLDPKKNTKTDQAKKIGQQIATQALKKKIKKVKFDRGPYRYHGRVKALANAAREAGLEF